MLRPTDIESLKGDKSRYAIVIGVAKRARDIAEKAEQDGVILIEKPVSLAINDLTSGDYKILMSDNNEEEADEAEEATEE
jgi:DNA-directed RNA polymerase subunit omega